MLTLLYGESHADKAHIPFVLESWRANKALFDFYIATPAAKLNTSYAAPNVRFILMSRKELDAAILRTLGVSDSSDSGVGPYWKPSTFTPAFASFFEELGVSLEGYSHWGYLDVSSAVSIGM